MNSHVSGKKLSLLFGAFLVLFLLVAMLMDDDLTAAVKSRSTRKGVKSIPSQMSSAGMYTGPLFATSEKTGDNPLVLSKLLPNMKRHDVRWAILYVMFEEEDLEEDDDVSEEEGDDEMTDAQYLRSVLLKAPGTIVPFFSTGIGGEEEGKLAGLELTTMYAYGIAQGKTELGENVLKGIGEVELYAWNMPHDDQRVFQLFDLASANGLAIMFHPSSGQKKALEAILKRYPKTTFLMHLFPEDFARDRQMVIDLMSAYSNLHFTIDVDHMLFDQQAQTGLLYKFEGSSPTMAASSFKTDFDRQRAQLLQTAISRYQPLIIAHPDRVTWGTEMSEDYTFDNEVYDRMIKFVREFIGSLPKGVQEKVAYKNAQRLFGKGVTLKAR